MTMSCATCGVAILACGPSLLSTWPARQEVGYWKTIAVNDSGRTIAQAHRNGWQPDWLCVMDPPMLHRGWPPGARGVCTHGESYQWLLRGDVSDYAPPDLPLIDADHMRRQILPGELFVSYTLTVAILLAVHLGARYIRCHGVDWAGVGYAGDRPNREGNERERWSIDDRPGIRRWLSQQRGSDLPPDYQVTRWEREAHEVAMVVQWLKQHRRLKRCDRVMSDQFTQDMEAPCRTTCETDRKTSA